LDGQTAESIGQSFPVLTLEQVYGAITFYLTNSLDIDTYLTKEKYGFEAMSEVSRKTDPMFFRKLEEAQQQMRVLRT